MAKLIDRTGETNRANNGQMMTIINYRHYNDIDIQFEDGTIVYKKSYNSFKSGTIKHSSIASNYTIQLQKKYSEIRMNEQKQNNIGLNMTIIAYRNSRDIDIQFDDGYIVQHRTYEQFKKGSIRHTNTKKGRFVKLTNRLGEININNQNLYMKIIEYNNDKDITIIFEEDGTILTHKRYNNFKNGSIINPNYYYKVGRPIKNNTNKLGETNNNKHNQKMIIIEYNKYDNIKVQFEDGTIVKTNYSLFKKGSINNPNYNYKQDTINKYINNTNINTKGINMTITNFIHQNNFIVTFETGYSKHVKSYDSFKKGLISHIFPYKIESMILEKPAYVVNNIGNFYCTCSKCGHKDIMTIEEMKDHMSKCIG